MKKMFALIAGACMAFAGAGSALADDVEIKYSGKMVFGFGLYDNTDWNKFTTDEKFDARQKMSNRFQFIVNENLKGVLQLNVTTTDWGHGGGATWGGGYAGPGAGGAMGADGVSVGTKFWYLDWLIPGIDVNTRMGLQWFGLPQAVWRGDYGGGGSIFDDNAFGMVLSKDITEEVGVSVAWFRPWDAYLGTHDYKYNSDEIDSLILSVPIDVPDVLSINPYTMFAMIGDVDTRFIDRATGERGNTGAIAPWLSATGTLGDNGRAWWVGTALTFSYLDPFYAYLDLMYGSYTADTVLEGDPYLTNTMDPDRDGWAVMAKFDYKMEYFTPSIWGWYASGSDGLTDHGMDGMMPSYTPYFGLTSFGFARNNDVGREFTVGSDPYGKWGIGASLDNIKYFDNLTSHIRVLYFGGTNNTNDLEEAFTTYGLFGWQDRGLEVNFDNVINIYDNLDVKVELGYIHLNLDNKPDSFDSNAYKGFVEFIYTF